MNNEKNKLIPERRFPEFLDDEEWEEKELSEVADRIIEKVGTRKLTTVSISSGFGFVSQADKFSRDISGEQYKNYIVLNIGDFSYNKGYSKRFPQGSIYKLKEFKQVAAPSAFLSFRFKTSFVADFYQGYFDNNYHGKQLKRFITSGARMDGLLNISAKDFFSIVLPTPKSKDEQQKIASCLSSLDEVIAAHSHKLEALKEHKKGLMQNLFPQEGETVPKYRFPEFKNGGDWEELMLDEAAKFASGGTPSKDNMGYWNGNIPWISASSMHDLIAEKSESNITDLAVRDGANITQKGNILILVRGSMLFKRVPICIAGRDVSFNQDVKALELKKEIDNIFFLYLLISKESDLLESVTSTGIGAGKLDTDELKKLLLKMPSNKMEQQKIASCLWNVDEFITAQEAKIEQLKLHKKGLMQGLLPNTVD